MSATSAANSVYRFGDFTLDLGAERLLCHERPVSLRPQSFDVLRYLVEHEGQLVTRDELLEKLWDGRTVTPDSVTHCLMDIRNALGDADRDMIETVPRRGYRFVVPLAAAAPPPAAEPANRPKRLGVMAMVLTLPMLAIVAAIWISRPDNAGIEAIPAVLVLPFSVTPEDTSTLALAEGIRFDVMTQLGELDGLKVIGKPTADQFEATPGALADIVRITGAGFLVGGEIERSGSIVNSRFWLVDSDSGEQIWAGRLERRLAVDQIVGLQSALANHVAQALGLNPESGQKHKPAVSRPANLAALEAYHNGMYFERSLEISTTERRAAFDSAIHYLQESIRQDPDWAPAHAALGRTLHFGYKYGDPDELLAEAEAHIERAIELDPGLAVAYDSLGYINIMQRDFDAAAEAFRNMRANGQEHSWGLAIFQLSLGNFEQAIEEYRNALSMDPLAGGIRRQLALAHACAGDHRMTIELIENAASNRDSDQLKPRDEWQLAWSWAVLGNRERSRQHMERYVATGGHSYDFADLHVELGEFDTARQLIEEARNAQDLYPFDEAYLLLETGDIDAGIAILEATAEEMPREFLFLACLPVYKSLAGLPQEAGIRERVGLPPPGTDFGL